MRLDAIANDNALSFYERMGFRAEGWMATRFRPALRMRLALDGGGAAGAPGAA